MQELNYLNQNKSDIMEDLRQRPDENRSQYGWRLLMHDLRNPKEPLPQQQPEVNKSKDGAIVNNIYNYPQGIPMTLKRFNFASIFATVVVVIFLIILGVVLWKSGALQHIYDVFRSLMI